MPSPIVPAIASRNPRRPVRPVLGLACSTLLFLPLALAAQHAAPDGASTATATRRFQLEPGLKLDVWAAEPQLENPVAFQLAPLPVDARTPDAVPGVAAFVAETHRYGVSVLDITQNTPWLLDDLSLRTVADRAAFLARTFATNASVLTHDSEILRRVVDRDGDGRAESDEVLADGFRSSVDGPAAGVLAHDGQVWLASIPNLWRFPAPSGAELPRVTVGANTGTNSTPSPLLTGFGVHIGVTGHDLHGLVLGPDGRLYLSFGDRGVHVRTREGETISLPDTGGVLRCEHDGQRLEVFCTGLRNPQELAFDDHGNLFTVDNDTAGADDCRVLHLVQDGDYGWRSSYQHMKGFGPWVREGLWAGGWDGQLPPVGKVSQGPAGLAFHPGTGFGDRFRDRFLHADFPGGIWSFRLAPRGASFAVEDPRKVLWNLWPTDVAFGPDGALYVLDWVEGWTTPRKGRIYRITDPALSPAEALASREVHRILAEDVMKVAASVLEERLGHRDRRVRQAAQFELARRGPEVFPRLRRVAFDRRATMPRLHALWAASQIARRIRPGSAGSDFSAELASLLPLLDDADPVVAGLAVQVVSEAGLVHANQPVAALLVHDSPRLRLAAAQALGHLMTQNPRADWTAAQRTVLWLEKHLPGVGRVASRYVETFQVFHSGRSNIVDFARTRLDDDPFLGHAAARHLARLERLEAGWAGYRGVSSGLAAGLTNAAASVRQVTLHALRRTTNAYAAGFLHDTDPRIVVEAARAIHDTPIPDAMEALAESLTADGPDVPPPWARLPDVPLSDHLRQSGRPWPGVVPLPTNALSLRRQFLNRALDAAFRVGGPGQAQALARLALPESTPASGPASHHAPDEARAEALFLLSRWEVLPAEPGRVPVRITPDPNHGAVPTINPENWPGWFDRIVGLWRPLPPRGPDDARAALEARLPRLLEEPRPDVLVAAVDALVRLQSRAAIDSLTELFRRPGTPSSVRRILPAAVAQLGAASNRVESLVLAAANDPDSSVRAAAVPLFAEHLRGPAARPVLERLIRQGLDDPTVPAAAQAAIRTLGQLPRPDAGETTDPLPDLVARLGAGRLPREFELDVIEAARQRYDREFHDVLGRIEARRAHPDQPDAGSEFLFGGDPLRGRAVFFEKTEVQCSRCHQVGGLGGTVGPALDHVGQGRERRELLESILRPSARFAPGFENATLELSDGREVSGRIMEETKDHLLVRAGEDGDVRVAASSVIRRHRGLSAMPEGLGLLLGPRELRDLVAFLAGLRP